MTNPSGSKHRIAFWDNYLAAIGAAALLLISLGAKAQVIPPASQGYAVRYNRIVPDSSLYLPTSCGVPTDSTFLFSQGFSGNGGKAPKGAIYLDSCGHHVYFWDPSQKLWHQIDGGGGGGDDSSLMASKYYVDTAKINLRAAILLKLNIADSNSAYASWPRLYKTIDSMKSINDARYLIKIGASPGQVAIANGSGTITPMTVTGDFGFSSSGVGTIISNAVTNAKAAQMPATTIKANVTGSTANATDATPAAVTAILPTFGTSANGLVPAPGGTPTGSRILADNGTWITPAGVGVSDSGFSLQFNNLAGIPLAKVIDGSGHRVIQYDTGFARPSAFTLNQDLRKALDSMSLLVDLTPIIYKGSGSYYLLWGTHDSLITYRIKDSSGFYHYFNGADSTLTFYVPVFTASVAGIVPPPGGSPTGSKVLADNATWITPGLLTRSLINSGSSSTISAGNTLRTYDFSSTQSAYTETLPASPADQQVVEFESGNTLTSGFEIVSWTLLPNSGQTIVDDNLPTNFPHGGKYALRYNLSTSVWTRK